MSQTAPHEGERLLDFAYGELSEQERREVQSHLSGCDDCRASLEDIQGVRKVMSAAPQVAAPAAGLDSLLAYAEQAARRAQAGPLPQPTWWRRLMLPLAGVTAAAVVGVVAHEVHQGEGNAARVAEQVAMKMPAADFRPAPGAPFAEAIPAEAHDEGQDLRQDRPLDGVHGNAIVVAAPAAEPGQLMGAGGLVGKKDFAAAPAPMKSKEAAPKLAMKKGSREEKAAFPGDQDAVEDRVERSRAAAGPGSAGSGRGAGAPPPPAPAQQVRDQHLREAFAEAPMDAESESDDKAPLRRAKAEARPSAPPAPASSAQVDAKASRAQALSDAAVQAYQDQDRELEARLLRQAVPLAGADRPLLSGILVRLCGAEYALGRTAAGDAACARVIQEFKGTAAARIAQRQRQEHHAALNPPATRSAKPVDAAGSLDSPTP